MVSFFTYALCSLIRFFRTDLFPTPPPSGTARSASGVWPMNGFLRRYALAGTRGHGRCRSLRWPVAPMRRPTLC